MDLGIEGRVAVVAASSKGLGRAIAEELAAEGADLVMCARGEAALNAAADRIRALGRTVVAIPADLSREREPERVIEEAIGAFGKIDILVTNTGGPPAGRFEDHDLDAWRAAVRLNLESVVGLTRAALPTMKLQRWGRIINVTSIAVKQPVENLILSNSVRAAVTGLARTLANEVASFGITVNCVMPGYTRTDRLDELAVATAAREGVSIEEIRDRWHVQIPMRRLGEPREFAALVAFLASERASYITGTSIPVDGGWIQSLL